MGSISRLAEIDAGHFEAKKSQFAVLKHGISIDPNALAIQVTYQSADHLRNLKAQPDVQQNFPFLSWTYADMQSAALNVVIGLRTLGIGPNSTLVTLLPNGVEWALLYWASMVGKFTFVSLDPGALAAPRSVELQNLLTDTHADAVVVHDSTGATAIDEAFSAINGKASVKIFLKSDKKSTGWTDFSTVISVDVNEETQSRLEGEALIEDPDRVCEILFTSGTTSGKPKGCPWTVAVTAHCSQVQDWGRCHGPGIRRALTTANFRSIAPLATLSTWYSGGCLVLPSIGFSPPDLLHWIENLQINTFVLVPAMVHALIAHPDFAKTDLSSLKSIIVGGDIVTRDLWIKATAAFPDSDFFIGHGMTEGVGCLRWPFHDQPKIDEIPWYANVAPIGKVQQGTRLKVADEENQPVERNQSGELHICSPGIIKGYQDGAKPEDFYIDGDRAWFKTGDVSMINNDGWVYILGRKKDIIKRAGVSLTPSSLESALDSFLNSQSSVFAVSHPELGQEPFAVVRDLDGHSKEEVMQHVLDVFGEASPLRGVATLSDLGLTDFPITTTGKILKRSLEPAVLQYLET